MNSKNYPPGTRLRLRQKELSNKYSHEWGVTTVVEDGPNAMNSVNKKPWPRGFYTKGCWFFQAPPK